MRGSRAKRPRCAGAQSIPAVIDLTDIVTLSMDEPCDAEVEQAIRVARQAGKQILAKDVKTHEQQEVAASLGCELFQGSYLSKPRMIQHRQIPASQVNQLQLISRMGEADVSVDELEAIIKGDAGLAVGLLKRINSAGMGVRQKIESIKHAITLMGLKPLRQWVSALVAAKLCQDKPNELLKLCVARAFFCEALSKQVSSVAPGSLDFYLTGLFSCMDAVLDCDLENILLQVRLPDPVVEALEGEDNDHQQCLTLALAQEQGDWTQITRLTSELGLDPQALGELQFESVRTADMLTA